ncbi:MAG: flagellar hook-length control protein FliK, partial [Syntrophobacteraceae bacterium]
NGHDVVMLSQQAEKQLKTRDSLPDPLNLQAAGHQFHNARIEMPGMEQSPDSGLHYYDPARSAELVEQYKEHSRSIGGHELVLEMDQGEFGKMSIKVGTRNDEVSAVVVTESEPARHALLKNSPELRQELQDQGLLLGKFQVDVDRDRSGRENSHQGQGQEGNRQARDAPSESTAVKSKVGRPSYVRNNGTLSQVSIFA